MTQTELQERILAATVALLNETGAPEQITVRQIAERAGVGVGSINYNFGSRDNLINEAIWKITGSAVAPWYEPQAHPTLDAMTRLREMFKAGTKIALQYRKFTIVSLQHSVQNDNLEPIKAILPLLREILGDQKSELEVRVLAFQLMAAVRFALIKIDKFSDFLGMNLFEENTINSIIDQMIDNLISLPQTDDNNHQST
ncbi:MAG TPA: TetR/AcrR family transcriptional regulator [Phototrophicaceae bacterium]|nr:TetR/AcrR family transcriptional regulator [Phototrophicaceae bacterium]